jgi:hypothetical protein
MRNDNVVLITALTCLVGCSGISEDGDPGQSASIIGGEHTAGFYAVFFLHSNSFGCSASLVGPRLFVTAAHCVLDDLTGLTADFLSPMGETTSIPVVATDHDPAFGDPQNGHDGGVGLLASDAPVAGVEVPSALPADLVAGSYIRMVGYGVDTTTQQNAGIKREVITTVNRVDDLVINAGDPSRIACHGDSGGPMYADIGTAEVMVGIASYLDSEPYDCSVGAINYGRIDKLYTFIAPYLAGTATPSTPVPSSAGAFSPDMAGAPPTGVPDGGTNGSCADPSECPQPSECWQCADGSTLCAQATCDGAVCGVNYPTCS